MRVKFFAIAAAASMVVTSTAAIAAAPFAASPLDQRPSQLQVSHRKGEKVEEASSGAPTLLVTILVVVTVATGATIAITRDNGVSPS